MRRRERYDVPQSGDLGVAIDGCVTPVPRDGLQKYSAAAVQQGKKVPMWLRLY
jgi:hypothetical protein